MSDDMLIETLRTGIKELCIERGSRAGKYSLAELEDGLWVEYLPPSLGLRHVVPEEEEA